MHRPHRVTVAACVGCGAMRRPGSCELGCGAEERLDLVAAEEHDELVASVQDSQARVEALRAAVRPLTAQPADAESAYRALQASARELLREQAAPPPLPEPARVFTTWWCPRCGGVDAPQPCLGICVWRPFDRDRRHRIAGAAGVYGIFITLFSYRIFFLRLEAADMAPLFWVVMGAAAISTNAGSMLILSHPDLPFLEAMRPFMEGTTLILWAWSTWLIPLLVIFGIWRHVVCRVPLSYHPAYWSLVFPLGMYTVATYRFSLAADYVPLRDVARAGVWVAFAVWALTAVGMFVAAARDLAARRVASGAAPARS